MCYESNYAANMPENRDDDDLPTPATPHGWEELGDRTPPEWTDEMIENDRLAREANESYPAWTDADWDAFYEVT